MVSAPLEVHDRREQNAQRGVQVERLAQGFGLLGLRQLRLIERGLDASTRLLVQYVPHAYGWRAMNLPLCRWVCEVARRRPVDVMFHEVAFPLESAQPWKHRLLAYMTRRMARIMALAAERVFVTIPAWEHLLREITPDLGPVTWLPVPSNLPTSVHPDAVAALRARYLSPDGNVLIGHFGTFGSLITRLLDPAVAELLREPLDGRRMLLIGRGAAAHRQCLIHQYPHLEERVLCAENLQPQAAAEHLAACDVMVQPFPDGVSCRRTTVMAALALGVPVVTNLGRLSESFWKETSVVKAVPTLSSADLNTAAGSIIAERRHNAAVDARLFYLERFDLSHTISRLRP